MTSAGKFLKRIKVVEQKKMEAPLRSKHMTIENTPMEDVGKGAYRNQECPCGSGKKLKKCDCGMLTRLQDKKKEFMDQYKRQREVLKEVVEEEKKKVSN